MTTENGYYSLKNDKESLFFQVLKQSASGGGGGGRAGRGEMLQAKNKFFIYSELILNYSGLKDVAYFERLFLKM